MRSGSTRFRHGALALSLLLLAGVYVSLAFDLAQYRAHWSPDSGARFGMLLSCVEHGKIAYLDNPNASVDPASRLHPLGGFGNPLPRGLVVAFPPLFPLLSTLPFRLWGWPGLAFWPLIGGLGAALFTGLTASRVGLRSAPVLPLLLGVCTSLGLYSVIFWDHSIQIALAAGGLYGVARNIATGRTRCSALAGGCLGLGVWIHEVFILLWGAACVTALWLVFREKAGSVGRSRSLSLAVGLIAGFLPAAGAWAGTNWLVYGSPGGPHLMGANDMFHPYHLRLILDLGQLVERSRVQLLGEAAAGPWRDKLALLLLVLTLSVPLGGTLRKLVPLWYVGAAGLSFGILVNTQWGQGLFSAAPVLVPALAAPWTIARRPAEGEECSVDGLQERFFRWLLPTALLYIVAVLVSPKTPEMNWGSRYVLTCLPLLFLLTAWVLEREWEGVSRPGRVLWATGTASLLLVSLVSQARGYQAIRRDLHESRILIEQARQLPVPVLVTDHFWLGPELTAGDIPQRQFHLRDEDADRILFFTAVERLGVDRFAWSGSEAARDSLARVGAARRPPWVKGGIEGGWTVFHCREQAKQAPTTEERHSPAPRTHRPLPDSQADHSGKH